MTTLTLKDPALLKDKCYVAGAWIGGAATIAVTNPADGSVIGAVPKLGAAETRRAIEAAETRAEALGEKDRQGARRHPAQVVRPDDGQPGGPGAHHDRRAGQAARRVARRDRLRRLLHRVVRRGGQAHLRRDDPLALAERAHHRDQAADRRGGGDHAVELPQRHDHPQGRRRRSPPAAPSSASRPARRRSRRWRWPSWPSAPAFRPASSTSSPASAREIGAELTSNPIVRDLTFTGSTEVGRMLMAQCAPTIKKLWLELGGNAPFIVFDDADLDAAVAGRDGLEIPQRRPDLRLRQPPPGAGRRLRRLRREARRARSKTLKVGDGFEAGVTTGR